MPPAAGEVFVSWVIRLAEAHGHKPRSLCSFVCGRSLDYNADFSGPNGDRLLTSLSIATRRSAEALRSACTLAGLEGRLFARAGGFTKLPWVLPHGASGARRPAMQFCPRCLDGPSPYFHRVWRLSLFTVCPEHALHLRHVCSACGAFVDPVRSEKRHRQGTLPLCWKCGFDLRLTPVQHADQVDATEARAHFTALTLGKGGPCWPAGTSLPEYFLVLSMLCASLLVRKPRLQSWRESAAKAAGAILPTPAARHAATAFDTLADPDLRRPVRRTAAWLLAEWPERFLAQARAVGTRTSDFAPSFALAPRWFLEPLQARLTPPRCPPTPTPGLLRVRRMHDFILAHRHEWHPDRQPHLARALREAGFYSPQTDSGVILRALPNTIARLRGEGKDYHRKMTRQVQRDTPQWSQLILLAKPYRKERGSNPARLRRGILSLCTGQFLSGRDLSELLHRSQKVLVCRYLVPMAREGQLETRFPTNQGGVCANPRQAYRRAPGAKESASAKGAS